MKLLCVGLLMFVFAGCKGELIVRDFDGDCEETAADLMVMRNVMKGAAHPLMDMNGDGAVTVADVSMYKALLSE